MCAKTSLVELGGWLSSMDLVITVDSGPMHMAAAAGIPVLAVFGATDHRRTGPYGSRHKVLVREDLSCRPCLSRTCLLKERDIRCLGGLSPDQVIAAARDMLARVR
jgi:ADP-heptose:LPS heptosyltransferase